MEKDRKKRFLRKRRERERETEKEGGGAMPGKGMNSCITLSISLRKRSENINPTTMSLTNQSYDVSYCKSNDYIEGEYDSNKR